MKIQWYGSKDNRSYYVSFDKINKLGFKTKYDAKYGVKEILAKLKKGVINKTPETITLEWYETLEIWKIELDKIISNGRLI